MKIHFICTGNDFPYQYYLAVKTAQKTQNAPAKIWFVKDIRNKYLDLLDAERSMVQSLDVPAFRGKDNHFIWSHTKDYYMWEILYKYGGFCFDLDTMSFRDITGDIADYDVVVCKQNDTNESTAWMSGLIGAKQGTQVIQDVITNNLENLQNPNMIWGTTGPRAVYSMIGKKGVITLPYPVGGARELLPLLYEMGDTDIAFNAKVVQLYAGARRFCATDDYWYRMTPEYVSSSDVRIAKAIRSILTEEEYNPKYENI